MNSKKGFSLVEILVVLFITTFSVFIIWKIYVLYVKISFSNPSVFQASFLAEEGVEAVKFMRDSSWTTNIAPLSTAIYYTLIFDGTTWGVTTTPYLIDNQFDRRVSVTDVFRDISGDIASGGTPDLNTKQVLVEVSWLKDNSTTTRKITTYVSNIFNN